MKRTISALSIVLIGVFLISSLLAAQIRESGAIHGNILDDKGEALPGATVSISGSKLLGGVKTIITDKDGHYRFLSLPAGPYTVSVELSGFAKMVREVIQLHANMTLAVDFKLVQSAVKEEIIVKATAPTIDIKSSTQGGMVMTNELLMNTPVAKSMLTFLLSAPGTGQDTYSAYGGTPVENKFTIDGIDVGYAQGQNAFEPDFNIFEEAEFQGLGLPAEYGSVTGGFINTVTKSGSNKFSGLAEIQYHGKGWNSQNIQKVPVAELYSPSMAEEKYETGGLTDLSLQFGGKIIHDRLWFFFSGAHTEERSYPLGTTGVDTVKANKLFGKLNFQLNKVNRITTQIIYDGTYEVNYGLAVDWKEEIAPRYDQPSMAFVTNWTSVLSQDLILETKAGYFSNRTNLLPHEGKEDVPSIYDSGTGETTGNWSSFRKTKNERYQGLTHLSYYIPSFMGSHDLKMGLEYQHFNYLNYRFYAGDTTYTYNNGAPVSKYHRYPYTSDYSLSTLSLFAQDSWIIGKRLTVNAGVRYDGYRINVPVETLGAFYKGSSLAPRIGLTYDILGDRKNVIKLHYGHYYAAVGGDFISSLDPRGNEYIRFDWDGNAWQEISHIYPSQKGYRFDPNTKQPYQAEISAGFERQLFKNASLSIDVFHRKGVRFLSAVLMNGEYAAVETLDAGPDRIPGTADDSWFTLYNQTNYGVQRDYLVTNPHKGTSPAIVDDFSRVVKGFEIIFQKRMANRWQLYASYNYSVFRGNSNGLMPYGMGTDPNQFTNAYGPGILWAEPHHFKLQGSVILPLDISLGVNAYLFSPIKAYARGSFRAQQGYVYVRRNEVPWDQPMNKGMDLRLEKRFSLKQGRMLTVMVNFINVFNSAQLSKSTMYGPYFGKANWVQDPRKFTIGARFWF